jgi:hypothetical protein
LQSQREHESSEHQLSNRNGHRAKSQRS